jgi:hypothetical protein
VGAQCVNPPEGVKAGPKDQERADRKRTPIEEKASVRWLRGRREAARRAAGLPGVRLVFGGGSNTSAACCRPWGCT